MRYLLNFSGIVCMVGALSCSTKMQFGASGSDRRTMKTIVESPIFNKHHCGFALYDPTSQDWLCQYNSDRYFTPASNTKILTLLTSLHVLGDSIETLRYVIRGDSLIFQGMADPSFLFSDVATSRHPYDVLRYHRGSIYYEPGEALNHYGRGWAWDDYRYAYQVEKSTLPMYGNRIHVVVRTDGEWHVTPPYFSDYIQSDLSQPVAIARDPVSNTFFLNDTILQSGDLSQIPFVISDFEIARLLADTLRRSVQLLYDDHDFLEFQHAFGSSRDTLLKRMMQESDNFIAEQLLMQCAFYMRGTFQSDSAIAVAQRMVMQGVPDQLQWVDGSGLSRYNLFTPRSIVWVLDQVARLQSMDYITEIFPAGGHSGTIAEWYGSDPPYVYAKTGTLRNQHCLSGFLRTDNGRWLIFSFMHNNFTGTSSVVKSEMERVLMSIKRKY